MRLKAFLASLCVLASPLAAQQPQRPAITGLAFTRFYASDPAASRAFYGKTLGFTAMEHDGMLIYPVNKLQWIEVIPHAPAQPGSMQAAVGFTTRNAAALAAYLTAHQVTIEQPLQDGEFAVRDPEGNLIVFVQSTAAGGTEAAGSVAKLVSAAPVSPSAVSHRAIHAGFVVHDRAREDAFWVNILGFHLYWAGGPHMEDGGAPEWASVQVPEGTDWLEYMLHDTPHPTTKELGGANHISLAVERIQPLLVQLERNGCGHKDCTAIAVGLDGKMLMNVRDPDGTRIEFMELQPLLKPCCSAFGGPQPRAEENQ